MEKKDVELKIDLAEEVAQGAYVNLAFITHNETEFVLDFIYVQPQEPKGNVISRIITSPVHIKRFFNALKENIEKYEQANGEIKAESQTFTRGKEYLV